MSDKFETEKLNKSQEETVLTSQQSLEINKGDTKLAKQTQPKPSSLVDNTTLYLLIGVVIFVILMMATAFVVITRSSNQNNGNYSNQNRSEIKDSYFPLFGKSQNRYVNGLNISNNGRKSEVGSYQVARTNINNSGYNEVILRPNSRLEGDINISNGSVTVMENSVLEGKIYSSGDTKIFVGNNARINGKIYTSGAITIRDNVEIDGYLESRDTNNVMTIGNNVEIKDGIKLYSNKILIGNNFKTNGDVELSNEDGTIIIENNANIKGKLKNTFGDVTIGNNNQIDGGVETSGNFFQGNNNRVKKR